MNKIKLEKLDEEIEKSLPETIRVIRAFYFKKLENKKEAKENE